MKYAFADIVVVDGGLIGVIVKSWIGKEGIKHEVYVRNYNGIVEYPEDQIERYLVRHKELSEEELEYQFNAINDI